MFAFAPYAPVFSPAIAPPPPPIDVASPPLIEPSSPPSYSAPPVTSPPTPYPPLTVPLPSNSAPPVKSPASSSPPMLSLLVPMPSNSAPPATPSPPVSSLPSPENVLTPPSPLITSNGSPDSPPPSPPVSSSLSPGNVLTPPSPLIMSNGSPDLPLPSPVTPLPPTVPLSAPATPAFQTPPFPLATAPATGTFPPSTVALSPPTTTTIFPPPSTPPLSEEMPWPPLSPPPVNIPPPPSEPPSSGNLPVAVEVQKPSALHMSSELIIGLVTGTVIFVFVLAVVTVLCCNKKKNKQKNLSTYHYEEEEPSPPIRSKGSHVIQLLPNSTLPAHFTEGGGASGTVNLGSLKAVSNRAPSMALDSVNGIFTYDDLIVATNCFSESNLLGEGGFGYVYKGVLPCGKEIAVKQLKTGSQQGEREFQAEVETISRVHHKHLVELIGYCVTRAERLLVYEFVPNNTLEFHLHGEGKAIVEWATRMKIALGSAKGLAYLHEDCNPSIIHRDIKASNVLLDFKFEAKVSDFGLAKIFHNTDSCITHLTTRVVGTFGYLAPEYASSGKLTEKSDVYSYGVMLLELITGRPPITSAGSRNGSLVDWARPLLAQALQGGNLNSLVDPSLQNKYKAEEMARMITCAAACVRHSAWLRPRMSQIVGALEGVVSLTDNSDYDATQYQQDIIRNFNLALSS